MLRTKHGLEYHFASTLHRRLTAIRDPNGNTLTLTYDAARRLIRLADASGRQWDLAYDAPGRLVTFSDTALSRSLGFAYDSAHRLIQLTDPLGERESFGYGADDLLVSITDRCGNAATIAYSAPLGPAGSRLVASIAKGGSTTAFAFDGGTRATSVTDPNGGDWVYGYSPAGLLTSARDPLGFSAGLAWRADKVLIGSTDRTGTASTFECDAIGKLTKSTIPLSGGANAVTTITYYAPCSRPATIQDPRGNTCDALGQSATFTYDATGNRLSSTLAKTGFTRVISESFDAADRAVTFSNLINGSGPTATFTLDQGGSRVLASFSGGGTTSYTYNARDLLTGYNAGGGNSATYAWDALDRLYGRTSGGSTVRFLYGSPPVTMVQVSGLSNFPVLNIANEPGGSTLSFPQDLDASPGVTDRRLFQLRFVEGFASSFKARLNDAPAPARVVRTTNFRANMSSGLPGTSPVTFRAINSIDLQGAGLHPTPGFNFAPSAFAGLTDQSGAVVGSRDPASDRFYFRQGPTGPFPQIPQISFPANGTVTFGDGNVFVNPLAFDAVTGSPLNGSYASRRLATIPPPPSSIPRFADTSTSGNLLSLNVCRTNLLFPFVSNQAGFDTGLAISSTTSDPFGTAVQTGACTLDAYGRSTSGAPAPNAYTTLASTPSFHGYIIAQCAFQYAHGFAFISDFGAQRLAHGYLALVLDGLDAPARCGEGLGHWSHDAAGILPALTAWSGAQPVSPHRCGPGGAARVVRRCPRRVRGGPPLGDFRRRTYRSELVRRPFTSSDYLARGGHWPSPRVRSECAHFAPPTRLAEVGGAR